MSGKRSEAHDDDITDRGNVVVVGSVNVDFVVSVDRIPVEGETVGEGKFAQHWGGKGANQAAVVARQGVHVAIIGAVGDDVLGRDALVQLENYGVDVRLVRKVPSIPTGTALVIVDHSGRNAIAVAPGANAHLDADAVREAAQACGTSDVVLVCFEVTDEIVLSAVEGGRRSRAQVIVNPAPARPLPNVLAGSGVVLTPNQHEVRALAQMDDPVAAGLHISQWTAGPVIVTLGEEGAVVCAAGVPPVQVPAPKVVALDTTGAGDAFNGTLAAGLAEGLPLSVAVHRAVASASLSVQGAGARGGIPSREQLEDFLRELDALGSPERAAVKGR